MEITKVKKLAFSREHKINCGFYVIVTDAE
jgi:hypothetical protein